MPAKGLLRLSFIAVLGSGATASFAQEPQRDMLGSFDLRSAVLSPRPLGPPMQFEPSQPSAHTAEEATPAVATRPQTKRVAAKPRAAQPKIVASKPRPKSAVALRKPRASPLESYARDARRQTWPCAGSGICAWTQPR